MASEKTTPPEARRRRVQRLKKEILLVLTVSILIPILLCVYLLYKVSALEEKLAALEVFVTGAQAGGGSVNSAAAGGERLVRDLTTEVSGAREVPQEAPDGTEETEEVLTEENGPREEEPVRKVYLTFDDGPSSGTDEILDILADYGVKATFFVVGKEGEWARDAYCRIVEEGHTLGMHSYTHDYQQIYASLDAYQEDLLKLQDYLYEVTGVTSVYVRFPGGSSNRVSRTDMRELIAWLEDEGFTYYDWNISSQDASGTKLTPEEVVENCLDGLEKKDNVIILMHDAASKHTTVEALPLLIESIQAMENTEILPITEDTVPVQHVTISQEETEE